MLSMTKKLDPSVATAGKNRICLSEFREQVLMFHQNPDDPVDRRIPATKSGFEMIRYLRKKPNKSCQKFSRKEAKLKNLEKSKFFNGSKRPMFRAIYFYAYIILRQIILIPLILVLKQMCASISIINKRPTNQSRGDSQKSDGPATKLVIIQVGTTQEVAPTKFSKPRTRSEEKKYKLQGERVVTDSSEEDKGKPEDPEEVKGRLYPPTETPALTSLKLQVLPVTSSQGITGTSVLELDISSAEALTPPYAASATQQQDEEGRHTLTPPDAVSVKQHKDEEGRS